MPPPDRTRLDAEATLIRVRTAAAEVFATRGLQATIADVAERAGVGVATVHRRFASKDDLIYEVYRERLCTAEDVARRAGDGADAWAAFTEFIDESIGDLMGDRGFWELVTGSFGDAVRWSRGSPTSELGELLAEHHRVVGGHLDRWIRRAQEAGQLRTDFEPADLEVLSAAAQATTAFGEEASRRAVGFIMDGLRSHPS